MKILFFAPLNISEKNPLPLNRAPRIRCYNIYKYLQKKHEIILIGGNSKERIKKYKEIKKNNILREVDGLYMESVNSSLKSFDLKFLKLVNSNNIPMTLFYRDIHWKFPTFSKTLYQKIKFKRKYKKSDYQLSFFKDIFDIIYSPTKEFAKFVGLATDNLLPPAGEIIAIKKNKEIGLLFSGDQKNGFITLLNANKNFEKKKLYLPLYLITQKVNFEITSNMRIYSEISNEIINSVHIGIIPLNATPYYSMSLSLKFMQYLSYGIPIICQKFPAFEKYNNLYDVCVFYDGSVDDLVEKIKYLIQNKERRLTMSRNALSAVRNYENWQQRVDKIVNELKSVKK